MSRLKVPYGTTAQLTTNVVQEREVAYDTTLDRLAYGDGVSAAGVPLAKKSEIDALTLYSATIYPVDQYADLQTAINTANAAGGGRVVIDADINISSSVTLKDYVVIDVLPGVTVTWTGGSSPMFTSASNNVLLNAGIIGYGAVLAMGASATKCLELYGPYQCVFHGLRITGTLTTSVVIDMRGDVTGGSNPIGNRNPVYCTFADILHSGTCGRFIRLRGEGTDGVSATYPVVLNTFHNMHCEDARVIGIDFARWVDHNYFSGITRIGIVGNNAVGVSYNSENPTVNCGVYTNHFSALAVDSFGSYTGRIGLDLNNCKDVLISHYYQYPVAEGGAYTISSDAESYVIGYFNETLGLIQYLTKGELFAGSDASNPVRQDIKNYDTGTSAAQWRAISGAATGATAILGAQAGISYIGSTSNHPAGLIANNVEIVRFETSGAVQMKVAGASLLPQANDAGVLGSATVAWSDLFLASGAVLNFNNGDVTLTHSSNALTGAGGQLLWGYNGAAGTAPFQSTNSTDAQFNAAAIFRSARATPAANDAVYVDFQVNDSAGNATTMARFLVYGTTVTDGAEAGRFDILLAAAATPTAYYNILPTAIRPNANDGASLGQATLAWADLFLASGAVVNFNNGDVTLTHASNNLTLDGGDLTIASTFRINLNNSQTTVGAAGGASALPLTPTGYIPIKVAGTEYVVPYYAKA